MGVAKYKITAIEMSE